MINSIISGMLIGIFVSAPMGPIGILCIQRTLNKGRAHGFITGIGASFSDIFYAILVGFCMSFIVSFINEYETYIQFIGAILIFLFGVHIYRSKPSEIGTDNENYHKPSYWKDFVTGFALCFSNPLIIFLFIALFARFNFVASTDGIVTYIIGLVSIFIGAFIWWTVLALLIGILRDRFTNKTLSYINKVIGSVLMLLAVVGVTVAFLGYAL